MPIRKPILLVAATEIELDGVRKALNERTFPQLDITCAVTGVGMVNTALHLTLMLGADRFDLAVNLGIAGSFDPSIAIGEVVQVKEDRIAWLGAEDRNGFIRAEEMGLCPLQEVVFNATATAEILRQVNAITVNMAHGSAASIRRAVSTYAPQTESMEGAAFFRVCEHFAVKSMQIRAISNRVEPRNRDAWNIPLALNNLTSAALQILEDLDNGN